MNLFTPITNAPIAKSPLADAASLGQAAARSDQTGMNQQDFSKYLHHLLDARAAAKPQDIQRQDFAGAEHLGPAHSASSERKDVVTRDARFDGPKAQQNNEKDERKTDERRPLRETHDKRITASTEDNTDTVTTDAERTVEASQEAGRADSVPAALSTVENASLKAVHLSAQIQVITTNAPATTDASLAAFARSMGMSDHTIQQLLGGAPSSLPSDGNKMPASVTTDASLAIASQTPVTAWPAGSLLQSLMGGRTASLPANPLTDMSTAGIAAQADPLQQVHAAMMEGLDQVSIQIGPMTTTATQAMGAQPSSTLAVLSMLDTQFTPQAVDSLQQEFDALPTRGTEDDTSQGLTLGGAIGLKTTAAGNLPTPALSASAQASHMADTYEKLSDKLATELAARLHQQISDGQWKMKFALKPASLGAVDIQLEMKDGKLAALFQADNPLTQDLLQNGSQRLKDALHNLGMSQTSVQVGQGQSQAHSQGQSHTSSETAKFGDNRGQTQDMDPNALAEIGRRRSSDSQFDIYA